MTRLNKFLAVALGLQIVLAVVVLSRSGESVNLKQEPLLAGFDAAGVMRLQVFEAGADKPGVDLVKRGTAWVLASHWDYPVDTAKIDAALAPLAKVTADPIASSSAKHGQQKVADKNFDKKLVISAAGKDTTLFVGVTKSRRTSVRLAGEDRVLAASGLPTGALSGRPNDWIALDYSSIPRDDIDKILIEKGPTKIELDRTGPAAPPQAGSGSDVPPVPPPRDWRVAIDGAAVTLGANEKIDSFAIETIVSTLSTIGATPADPKRDASKPAAVITVTKKDGKTVVFDVVDAGQLMWWVKQRGLDRATDVEKSRFESVMAADRSKLVAKSDPPAAGAGSGSAGLPFDTSQLQKIAPPRRP